MIKKDPVQYAEHSKTAKAERKVPHMPTASVASGFEMAKNIVINAKTSRPAVCNAAEKLLVNEKIAKEFMPIILAELRTKGVEVRGDESSIAYDSSIVMASEEEWYNE